MGVFIKNLLGKSITAKFDATKKQGSAEIRATTKIGVKIMKTITNETNIEELTRDKNRLLNEVQASRLLGVSNQTLRQSIRYKGRIRYYKVNNRVSYKVSDVLAYLEKCKVEPTN